MSIPATQLLPTRFKAAIGDYFDTSYEIELIGEKIKYKSCDELLDSWGQKIIHPDALSWIQFRKTLDQINIWRWQTKYLNPPGILGGIAWYVDIWYPDQGVLSSGSNRYPMVSVSDTDSTEQSDYFKQFLQAVEKLIGQRFSVLHGIPS